MHPFYPFYTSPAARNRKRFDLYQGDCRKLLPNLFADRRSRRPSLIFADPPYNLSNGGFTCHSGKRVDVDKGAWDRSNGLDNDLKFAREWLAACRDALAHGGTIWVSGTHHVIFNVGYAAAAMGMKILNSVTWQKPNPPPNLSCRYFTHSTETVLWINPVPSRKHIFNYEAMRKENGGKQMKDVWTFSAPKRGEKTFGKHTTQKPLDLLRRIVRAASHEGDVILDPFCGSGTTGIAAASEGRAFIGIEREEEYCHLTRRRHQALVAGVAGVAQPRGASANEPTTRETKTPSAHRRKPKPSRSGGYAGSSEPLFARGQE